MANYDPPPYQDPIGSTDRGVASYLGDVWQRWFLGFTQRVNQTAQQFPNPVALTGQTASIGTTPLPLPSLPDGLVRINIYFRVTTAASVSSSLIVNVIFTDDGIACTRSTTAYTGNAVNAPQSAVFIISADGGTPISVSTTYISVGTAMAYKLDISTEAMP